MRTLVGLALAAVVACGAKRDNAPKKEAANKPGAGAEAPAFERPQWIRGDQPGASSCEELAAGLACQGVSPRSTDTDSAKQAAIGVALDALAVRVAREAAAQKAGRTWTPNDQSPVSPETVATTRKALEAALGISPSAPPHPDEWFWEEYAKESGSGTETLGFARMTLPPEARKALAAKLGAAK